ncbi:MAG: hypothetical protein J0L61_08135 [Planctomycetes bacterium]|nr:hypothetical protein [Planctomycetota bacterium]
MKFHSLIVLLSAAALFTPDAWGVVTVTPNSGVTVTSLGGGHYSIAFGTSASGPYTISTGSTDVIDAITSAATAVPVAIVGMDSRAASIGSVGVIGSGRLHVASLRASGNVGAVSAHRIDRVESSAGDLTGPVAILPPVAGVSPILNEVLFQSGVVRANISNPYGDIGSIVCNRVLGASASAPVTISCSGYLYDAFVAQDATHLAIADPSSTPSGRTMAVNGLTVGGTYTGSIKARFVALTANTPSQATINIGQDFDGLMDFSAGLGDPELQCLPPQINPASDEFEYYPTVRIGGSVSATSVIQVPEYVPAGQTTCHAGGVQTQVVVNANNAGERLLGEVLYGYASPTALPIERTPDIRDGQYSVPLTEVGYGSIGVAPFALNGVETKMWLLEDTGAIPPVDPALRGPFSEPPAPIGQANDTFIIPAVNYPEYLGFQLEFFGPVISSAGGFGSGDEEDNGELVFEVRSPGAGDCWESTAIGFKVFQPSPRRVDLLGALVYNTGVQGAPTRWTPGQFGSPQQLQRGRVYRLRVNQGPGAAALMTCDLGLNPNPLARLDYFTFQVSCLCPTDLNFDGAIDTGDLPILLGDFGKSQPSNPVPCPPQLRADLNLDNTVSTPDLVILLGQFGTSCPTPPCSPALALSGGPAGASGSAKTTGDALATSGTSSAVAVSSGTPPGPVVAALGFTSMEAYGAYVDGLSESDRSAHFALLMQVASSISPETPAP